MKSPVADPVKVRVPRAELLARLEHLTELPLMLLAFLMVPLVLWPLLWHLSPEGLERCTP